MQIGLLGIWGFILGSLLLGVNRNNKIIFLLGIGLFSVGGSFLIAKLALLLFSLLKG